MGATHRGDEIITVSPATTGSRRNSKVINSRNPFFGNEVIISILVNKVIVKKATIDTQNSRKFYKCPNGSYQSSIVCDIPEGRYVIDSEDSNEDKLVIYFKQ